MQLLFPSKRRLRTHKKSIPVSKQKKRPTAEGNGNQRDGRPALPHSEKAKKLVPEIVELVSTMERCCLREGSVQ